MQPDSRLTHKKADPYRAARKPPSPDGYYESPSFTSEQIHSRSPSESSTSRLAASPIHGHKPDMYSGRGEEEYDYYNQQDPYAPRQGEKKKKKRNKQQQHQHQDQDMYSSNTDKRANSYLPYSNHKRDPYDPVEPIYLEDDVDDLPSFNSPNNRRGGPVGSILQDNIAMDMMSEEHDRYAPDRNHDSKKEDALETLPAIKKKKWWTRLGIKGKTLLFSIFGFMIVCVVIGYFVWPREPVLAFQSVELDLNTYYNYTDTSIVATWDVKFSVDNSKNFVPTKMDNFAVSILDSDTGVTFGTGNSGSLSLKGRSIDQVITVPININFTGDPTNETLKDLVKACSIIPSDLSTPTQTLNIKFEVTYYIAGIISHAKSTFSPSTFFSCPIPES